MRRIGLIAACILIANSPLHADPAKPVDYDAMYSSCLKEAKVTNNESVTTCAGFTSETTKKEMNALYDTIYAHISATSPADAKKFEASQKAWLVYRNTQCELAGSYVGSPMYYFCPMKLNIARVIELRQLAGG
jgi:uncharacterized protein YecT (DUF1311 family)